METVRGSSREREESWQCQLLIVLGAVGIPCSYTMQVLKASQCLRLVSPPLTHSVHSNLTTSVFTHCDQLHNGFSLLSPLPPCFYSPFLSPFLSFEWLSPLFGVSSRHNSRERARKWSPGPVLSTTTLQAIQH